ncbi:MAG: alpha-amylase [Bacteroidota bacterium]
MPKAICLYFQAHQPYRHTSFPVFSIGTHAPYEDKALNLEVLNRVSDRCYLPVASLWDRLGQRFGDQFQVNVSASGHLLQQLETHRPAVIERWQKLSEKGQIHWLGETFAHSLSFFFSREEFFEQVIEHREKVWNLFQQDPRVFRNTELAYQNPMGFFLKQMGYKGMLVEGLVSDPNKVYSPPHIPDFGLLPRHVLRSDDLAFRFADPSWEHFPLQAEDFAAWMLQEPGEVLTIGLDMEALGEHISAETGIWEFWEKLIEIILREGGKFLSAEQALVRQNEKPAWDVPMAISWADQEKDLSAWMGNSMQQEALHKVYELEAVVKESRREDWVATWRKLQNSDHFYYMATKKGTDGNVHQYFSPFSSPYDAYIYFMNIIADFQLQLRKS